MVPTVAPAGGTYDHTVVVTLTTPCTSYYTLDGSDPRISATRKVYDSPFAVTRTSVLTVAGLCEGIVLPTPTPIPVHDGPWDPVEQWSLSFNPNGVWRYEDGNGNLLTTPSNEWNLPDFPSGIPGWLGPSGLIHAGWAVSNGHHGGEVATSISPPKDWPEGTLGTHGPTYLTWTSPINGNISILGSFWKMRDWITASGAYPGNGSPRPCPISILKNKTVIEGPYTLSETSSEPGKSSSNPAVMQAQTTISSGDKIRIEVGGIDFVGMEFVISQINKRTTKAYNKIISPDSGEWTDLLQVQYTITSTPVQSNVNSWIGYE